MQIGAVTTSEPTDEAPAAIALIGPAGTIERATTRFLERFGADEECLSAHQRKIERIITGKIDHVAVMLDGEVADVSAVVASDAQRYALVSVPLPPPEPTGDSPNPLLDKPIAESSAVVWLKDLTGRYLRVNSRYVEELGVDAERVRGKTDAELELSETIEGMRQGGAGGMASEPLELEYTVGQCEDRPPYSVVRFAFRDRSGEPVAVCGVAAPLSQAWAARAECDRLMRIERWSRLPDVDLREELLDEWGLAPLSDTLVASNGKSDKEGQGEQFAAIAAELDTALATSARLDRELAEERRQVMALREASILSARRAHELLGAITAERARVAELEQSVSRAEARVVEVEGELAAERSRSERAESQSASSVEQHQQAVQTLELELAGVKGELERARAEADEARRAAQEAEAAAATAAASGAEARDALEAERARADRAETALGELRAASELTESETSAALTAERERRHGLEAELAAARKELERAAAARSETDAAGAEAAVALEAERERANGLEDELAALRGELTRVEQTAQEEMVRAEQAAQEEMARAQQALGEEVQRAQQAARGELAHEHESALAALRQDLDRARSEAAESAHALAGERQHTQALELEMSAVRTELERVQRRVAESVNRSEAEAHLASVQTALEAERRAVETLRAELDEARRAVETLRAELDEARRAATAGDQTAEAALEGTRAELERARSEAGEARAELERVRSEAGEARAALEAERRAVESLRAELGEAGDREPVRDEQAELALVAAQERVQALEAELEALRAAPPAQAAPAPSAPAPEPAGFDGPRWGATAQRALAGALSGVGEWRMVLQQVVKTLTVEGGWDAAIAFCPDERHRLLECAAISTTEALADSTFETQSWQHRPAVTRLEFGAAWGRSEPTAVADLVVAEDRLLKAAAGQGMGSAVFVPVRHEGDTIAILGLLSGNSGTPPHELLLSLEAVGLHVGAIGHLLTAAGAPRWRVGRL